MTDLYITIDTEYSPGFALRHGRDARRENFESSILGRTAAGDAGIGYQMDVLDRHGLKGVFFVDPMPALLWGVEAIADIVGPIVARRHDVQLHIHTEWLAMAGAENPLPQRTGANIRDFSLEEQCLLIDRARSILIAAGAPPPVAFRAGNYGADDNTLRALALLGIGYDSSHCPGFAASDCAISLGPDDRLPLDHCGVTEVPIGCIESGGNGLRHAQVTALSAAEMLAALDHANRHGIGAFTLVSHSFELLSRDRRRINRIVRRRFERLCAGLARIGVTTATYAERPPAVAAAAGPAPVLPHSRWRSGRRLAEQLAGNLLYGAR